MIRERLSSIGWLAVFGVALLACAVVEVAVAVVDGARCICFRASNEDAK